MNPTDCIYYDDGCCLLRSEGGFRLTRDCYPVDCESYKPKEQ